jgi:hypothetical protein
LLRCFGNAGTLDSAAPLNGEPAFYVLTEILDLSPWPTEAIANRLEKSGKSEEQHVIRSLYIE